MASFIPKSYKDYKWYHWVGGLFLVAIMLGGLLSETEDKKVEGAKSANDPRLPQLIAQLRQSDNPQRYMELAICYESMYRLMTRTDDYKLDLDELKKTRVVLDANGPFDVAAKEVLSEYCPNGPNDRCLAQFPQNAKGWFSGNGAVVEAFSSPEPNRLITGGSPGNNPLVQRNIMAAYCQKFGYPLN